MWYKEFNEVTTLSHPIRLWGIWIPLEFSEDSSVTQDLKSSCLIFFHFLDSTYTISLMCTLQLVGYMNTRNRLRLSIYTGWTGRMFYRIWILLLTFFSFIKKTPHSSFVCTDSVVFWHDNHCDQYHTNIRVYSFLFNVISISFRDFSSVHNESNCSYSKLYFISNTIQFIQKNIFNLRHVNHYKNMSYAFIRLKSFFYKSCMIFLQSILEWRVGFLPHIGACYFSSEQCFYLTCIFHIYIFHSLRV